MASNETSYRLLTSQFLTMSPEMLQSLVASKPTTKPSTASRPTPSAPAPKSRPASETRPATAASSSSTTAALPKRASAFSSVPNTAVLKKTTPPPTATPSRPTPSFTSPPRPNPPPATSSDDDDDQYGSDEAEPYYTTPKEVSLDEPIPGTYGESASTYGIRTKETDEADLNPEPEYEKERDIDPVLRRGSVEYAALDGIVTFVRETPNFCLSSVVAAALSIAVQNASVRNAPDISGVASLFDSQLKSGDFNKADDDNCPESLQIGGNPERKPHTDFYFKGKKLQLWSSVSENAAWRIDMYLKGTAERAGKAEEANITGSDESAISIYRPHLRTAAELAFRSTEIAGSPDVGFCVLVLHVTNRGIPWPVCIVIRCVVEDNALRWTWILVDRWKTNTAMHFDARSIRSPTAAAVTDRVGLSKGVQAVTITSIAKLLSRNYLPYQPWLAVLEKRAAKRAPVESIVAVDYIFAAGGSGAVRNAVMFFTEKK